MAKKIYPGAEFEVCDNEIGPFPFELFAQLALLAPLPAKTKENLEKCRGALRLRRFRKNQTICRQGAEDCTAFYILKSEDLEKLRNYLHKKAQEAPVETARMATKLKEMEAAAEKAQQEAKVKDAEKIQKQIEDLQDKRSDLQRELAQLPALMATVDQLPTPQEQLAMLGITAAEAQGHARVLEALKAGDQANQALAKLEQDAALSEDKQRAGFLHELRSSDARKKRTRAKALEKEDDALADLLRAAALAEELRQAAVVSLGSASAAPPASDSWLQRLTKKFTGMAAPAAERPTLSIPFDGPTDISSQSRQAILHEGELFGEMACLTRSPRTATVVAARDCYMLEMLSNILTEIDKDPGYQKDRARIYKERALNLHLRDLSIFRALTDEQFARVFTEIRGTFELISFKTGDVICDEHERSDYVYLVRSGLVQVKKNVSALLSAADITSWRDLGGALRSSGPAAAIWRLLPAEARALLESTQDAEQLSEQNRAELVHALNQVIKNRQLPAAAEVKEIISGAALRERVQSAAAFQTHPVFDRKELDDVIKSVSLREPKEQPPGKVEEWSELNHRRFNRLLVEEALPNCLRRLPLHAGPDATLTYCSRGDFIGEMGVCRRQPRSSTCIAFGQPRSPMLGPKDEDVVQVELVRIPGEVFLNLMELFPVIREKVAAEIPIREKRDIDFARQARPKTAPFSRESERLGLVQGQQLMLIDMERCTLCGECVRGCVDSHADGRSRLFLSGHRFGKYMVPMTCRSCLDPVCMIDCPVRSIQRGANREIVIKDWCIGCQKCAKNCPYDSIKMHDLPVAEPEEGAFRIRNEIAVVCDLCSTLSDQNPRCVYACPHEAAVRIDARVELPVL